ncbi:hypothetical protein DdX_08173 [Ditylenchus destructor]|uniref:Uncharacterized protein n=1 Tax=Ditylenchus destructor TaxID=166010 RepID=A0AAD4N1R3_9BILA|nr:hypothetical protein DdX_08173 [Ditylenchus destructor]
MEERSSSVSEDSSFQAEEENSRDTVVSDVANVLDIHHGPVIQAIQTELGVCHPTLGNFILSLKKVQHGRDQQYMQWISGRRPKDKRKKYKDADKRILEILQEYQRNERTVIELLRGIAQNIVIDDVVGIDDEISKQVYSASKYMAGDSERRNEAIRTLPFGLCFIFYLGIYIAFELQVYVPRTMPELNSLLLYMGMCDNSAMSLLQATMNRRVRKTIAQY